MAIKHLFQWQLHAICANPRHNIPPVAKPRNLQGCNRFRSLARRALHNTAHIRFATTCMQVPILAHSTLNRNDPSVGWCRSAFNNQNHPCPSVKQQSKRLYRQRSAQN
eukprot:6003021-Amphidinium_carterae.1